MKAFVTFISRSYVGELCTGKCGLAITERTEWITKGKRYDGTPRLIHRRVCWPCGVARIREWDATHRDRRKLIDRRAWLKHKEKRLAYNRRHRKLNREKYNAINKRCRAARREAYNATKRRHYRRNRAHILYLQKMWRLDQKALKMLGRAA